MEISGVPESGTDNDLEGKVLNLLENIDVEGHPDHIEACHWLKSAGPKKIIIKLSRRKDEDKNRRAKKKLKGLDLSSIDINSVVFINNSLCRYYKNLWAKCKNVSLLPICGKNFEKLIFNEMFKFLLKINLFHLINPVLNPVTPA